MNLQLIRKYKKDDYTIGSLYIDGKFFCNTLEDAVREIKIQDKTAIPEGHYQVILNFSNRFQRLMPLILDVPDFEGIRIHSGSTQFDTSGCILVGRNTIRGQLTDSKLTFDLLFAVLSGTKEPISIDIL